jgi:hypothetical protein
MEDGTEQQKYIKIIHKRGRGYIQGKLAYSSHCIPLYISAIGKLDAYLLRQTFHAWRSTTTAYVEVREWVQIRQIKRMLYRWLTMTRYMSPYRDSNYKYRVLFTPNPNSTSDLSHSLLLYLKLVHLRRAMMLWYLGVQIGKKERKEMPYDNDTTSCYRGLSLSHRTEIELNRRGNHFL